MKSQKSLQSVSFHVVSGDFWRKIDKPPSLPIADLGKHGFNQLRPQLDVSFKTLFYLRIFLRISSICGRGEADFLNLAGRFNSSVKAIARRRAAIAILVSSSPARCDCLFFWTSLDGTSKRRFDRELWAWHSLFSLAGFGCHSTTIPNDRQKIGSCRMRIPYCLAFLALPDWVFGSATMRISSFFVTLDCTLRPLSIAICSANLREMSWPWIEQPHSPVKQTVFPIQSSPGIGGV